MNSARAERVPGLSCLSADAAIARLFNSPAKQCRSLQHNSCHSFHKPFSLRTASLIRSCCLGRMEKSRRACLMDETSDVASTGRKRQIYGHCYRTYKGHPHTSGPAMD